MIYSFPSRWWASLSAGYGWGGESRVNGQPKDDRKSNLLSALSIGLPHGQTQGLKLGYLRGDTQNQVGSRTNSFFVGWTVLF